MTFLGLHLTHLLWVALWLLIGGGFVVLVRRGYNYVDGHWATAGYFAFGSLVVGRLFWPILGPRIRILQMEHAALILCVVLAYLGIHRWLRRTRQVQPTVIETYPHIYWLRLDDRYIVSKIFEVLFQQTMVLTLSLYLSREGYRGGGLTLCFMGLFAIVHIPIMRLVGTFFGRYYLLSSLGAAFLFPHLILSYQNGHVYSYLLHVGYYAVSTILFACAWYPKRS